MKNTQPPPAPTPKTPEQVQLENIEGSLQCVCHALSVLRKEPLTVGNVQQTHGTIAWLESVEKILRKDFNDVYSRMQMGVAQQAMNQQPAPEAPPVPIKSKKKK